MADEKKFDDVVDAHREQLEKLVADSNTLMKVAETESRDLKDDETDEIKANTAEFTRINALIEVREAVIAQNEELDRTLGRMTDPDDLLVSEGEADDEGNDEGGAPVRPRAQAKPTARSSARVIGQRSRLSGAHGFRDFGDFAMSVKNAGMRGGEADGRLMAAAASTFGNEGSGTDGGFAVPPDFREKIMEKAFGEDSLISRTDQQVVSSNTLTFPTSMTTPWGASGAQARWTGESIAATQDKEPLQEMTVKLNKLSILVPMTEELLEDAPAMGTFVAAKAAVAIDYKISDAIVNGSGAGQPLGFANSPVLIVQNEDGAQAADTLVAQNFTEMLGRLPVQMRRNAVWLIHPDAESLLPLMSIGDHPVYLPPGGLRDAPFGSMLGRPVIPHQTCQTVGDQGDVYLVALDQYLTATKAGGVRAQTSIHLWFDQGITAFRFDLRVAGQPWWSEVTTAANGNFTQSPFITLQERT